MKSGIRGRRGFMELLETIKNRKSIRAFKPDPVPQTILQEIMEGVRNTASWANSQPWEFALVAGSKLEEIQQGFLEKGEGKSVTDIAHPPEFPEPYISRRRALGSKEYALLGINREDKEGRAWWREQNFKNFGAPCVIYILIDRAFFFQAKGTNVWPVFDCGMAAQNIMLLAVNYGLGTIVQAQSVVYSDIVREVLTIPESKLILIGISIGYPDWEAKIVKSLRSDKEPVEGITRWYGFEQV
jgi:nitroreductase